MEIPVKLLPRAGSIPDPPREEQRDKFQVSARLFYGDVQVGTASERIFRNGHWVLNCSLDPSVTLPIGQTFVVVERETKPGPLRKGAGTRSFLLLPKP